MEASHILNVIAGLILGMCCYFIFVSKRGQSGVPMQWPLVGMFPSVSLHFPQLYDWFTKTLIETGGTFMFKGSSDYWSAVFTSDPDNIEYILKTNFSSFPKGRVFTNVFRDLLGHGILNVDGESWAVQRRVALTKFNSISGLNYALKSVQDSVRERLMPILEGACSNRKAINLQDVFLRLAFDQVCKFTLGVETGYLSPGLPDFPFANAFGDAIEAVTFRFLTPIFMRKIGRRLGLGIDVRLLKALRTIDRFAADIISSKRKELESEACSEEHVDLLSVFMESRDENGDLYSDKFLRDICINFILAGREATSVALSWFLFLVLRHSYVEEKLVEEIHGVLKERPGWKPDECGPAICFSREELKRMHYLHACLTESMRLYPPVPLNLKEATEDVVLPNGTSLKRGTIVANIFYATGRMETVWGEDCKEFKPERWLRKGNFVNHFAYKFTAFNGGPRMCLGKDFAYLQMKQVAASILYRFRLKMVNEQEERVRYKVGTTLYMKGGLLVTLHPREMPDL